jgi:hypothetical protein
MESRAVIEVIRRHQAKFRERCRFRTGVEMNDEARVDFWIAEEYDSLLAEIEALEAAKSKLDEQANEIAESEILGDQGQSGG